MPLVSARKLLGAVLIPATLLSTVAGDRTFYVWNKCQYKVWPAIFTGSNSPAKPSAPTGWELDPGHWVSFAVPDDWTSGRIWGRRDCDFSSGDANGPNTCQTGGCVGGLLCDPSSGTGVPPASLAEWTLSGGGIDWYDVSLVDGANIPISIQTDKGCPEASCPTDFDSICPPNYKHGEGGCLSACKAGVDPDPANSPSCCTGIHNTSETCPSSGVPYYSTFKKACSKAYIYAYDDASSLFNCSSSLQANYMVTFCPGGGESQ